MQLTAKVVNAELDGILARIESHLELGTLPQITDANNVPCCLWRFSSSESADERELLRKALWENVSVIGNHRDLLRQTIDFCVRDENNT